MDIQFLRTVALLSQGSLRNISHCWQRGTNTERHKSGLGFTLEQIAAVLYPIERKRAKFGTRIAGVGIEMIGTLVVFGSVLCGWKAIDFESDAFLPGFFAIMFGIAGVIHGTAYAKRFVYRYLMSLEVPAAYTARLKEFSDTLHFALKHLDSNLQTITLLERDDISAQAVDVLDAKALTIVRLEQTLSNKNITDDVYGQTLTEAAERREEFKLAYSALAALSLVSGGYSNFFRRAWRVLDEAELV